MRRAGFGLLCLIAASGAIAADMLPLKRGIYVDIHVPCKGASTADTLSYWGGRNGINEAKLMCSIKRITRKGAVFSLERSCESAVFEGTFEDGVNITVLNRQSFTISGGHHLGQRDRSYRYCGSKGTSLS